MDLPLTKLVDAALELLKKNRDSAIVKDLLGKSLKSFAVNNNSDLMIDSIIGYLEESKAKIGSATVGTVLAESQPTSVNSKPNSLVKNFREPTALMVGGNRFVGISVLIICTIIFIATLIGNPAEFFRHSFLGIPLPIIIQLIGIAFYFKDDERIIALNQALEPQKYLYIVHRAYHEGGLVDGTVALVYFSAYTGKVILDDYGNIKYTPVQSYYGWLGQNSFRQRYLEHGYQVDNLLHVPPEAIDSWYRRGEYGAPIYSRANKEQFDEWTRRYAHRWEEQWYQDQIALVSRTAARVPGAVYPSGRILPSLAIQNKFQALYNLPESEEPEELAEEPIDDPISAETIKQGSKYAYYMQTNSLGNRVPVFGFTWDYFQDPEDVNALFHNSNKTVPKPTHSYESVRLIDGAIQLPQSREFIGPEKFKWTIRKNTITNILETIKSIVASGTSATASGTSAAASGTSAAASSSSAVSRRTRARSTVRRGGGKRRGRRISRRPSAWRATGELGRRIRS